MRRARLAKSRRAASLNMAWWTLRVSTWPADVWAGSGGERRILPKHLCEADLVAGEPPSAAQAVASNLLRITRPIDALVSDRLEEGRLQRQREDVHHAPFDGECFDRGDDLATETVSLRLGSDGNRRDLGHGRRILLQRTARPD